MTRLKLSLRKGNSKLGRIYNISLPPGLTCAKTAKCYEEGCYARKFYNLRPQCRNAWDTNYALYLENPEGYFRYIQAVLSLERVPLFRWHVSGDIPDIEYLRWMHNTADVCPDTRFLCFTKRTDLLGLWYNDLKTVNVPKNLRFVLSMWPGVSIDKECDDKLSALFPKAWMRDSEKPDPRIPRDAVPCDGGCDKCGLCWHMKAGDSVVFDKH